MRPAPTIGMAVNNGILTLVWRDSDSISLGTAHTDQPLDSYTDSDFQPTFGRLSAAAPPSDTITVTLLRPLAQTRTVRLPRMATATLERVLMRDWARHIIGARAVEHTVSAELADRGRWRASFAPTAMLEGLALAAGEQGWSRVHIRTSDDAVAGAARALAPREAQEDDLIAVVCDPSGPTDAFHLRLGAPWLGRRFLDHATDDDVALFARTHASKAPIIIFGGGPRAIALARTLGEQGRRARVIDTGQPVDSTADATFAVLGTLSAPLLPLRAPVMSAAHSRRMRTRTRWLALAAAAALLGALALEGARVSAALDDVRAQRADISGKVSNAVMLRSEIEARSDVAAALAAREAGVSQASAVLAAVTVALPAGTALTALNVAGDSITVEGESSRSAAVYESLRAVPLLEQVKLAAPLRQERQAGDVAVEHFAFSARVRSAASPARRTAR